jgi:hypothetical protein
MNEEKLDIMIGLLEEIKNHLCKDCIPLPTKLLTEFLNHEDIDGNGLIYGIDFIFKTPPPALIGIRQQILNDNPNIRQISMEEFNNL